MPFDGPDEAQGVLPAVFKQRLAQPGQFRGIGNLPRHPPVVDVPPPEGLHEVDHPFGDRAQAFAQPGEGFPLFPQHAFFKGYVVDEHARPFGDLAQELLRDSFARIRAGRESSSLPTGLYRRIAYLGKIPLAVT